MSNERNITIFFTDGSDLALTFPKQEGNPHLLAKRIQAALDSRQLGFEIDGELHRYSDEQYQISAIEPLS
jgi:hypothetical protein